MAATVRWHVTMSLDGYISGPDDDQSWVFEFVDVTDPGEQGVADVTGAVVAGRRSYDVGVRDGRDVLDGAWSGPQFLMTHREIPGAPPAIAIRLGDVRPVIEEARHAAGEGVVLLIGADIARQALDAGVVDEVMVHIAPVMLGGGTRFRGPGRVDLRLREVSTSGGVVTQHYDVSSRSGE